MATRQSPNTIFNIPNGVLAEERVNKGMITSIDPADLDNGALVDACNMRVRFDKTSRRAGRVLVNGSAGIGRALNTILLYKKNDGNRYLIRIHDNASANYENSGAWTSLVGSAGGGLNTKYQGTTIADRFIVSNDGATKLKEIVIPANTIADLSISAPQARFVTSAFNRVVAANYPLVSPVQIGWSADGVPDQFDSTINETAGSGLLMDSPSDLGDPVMGVLGLENILVIPREFSLWIGAKQPIASNPFNFMSVVGGIGTNAPYSVARFLKGICFADTKTATVWYWGINGMPDAIGRMVEKDIFKNLSDPAAIVGTFNSTFNEYSLLVPTGSDYARIWVYNFLTKAWTYDEVYQVTTISDQQYAYSSTPIDSLVGTIDALAGTIGTLGASASITTASRLAGKKNGDLNQEDDSTTDDAGVLFTGRIISKDFKVPHEDEYISEVRFEYQAYTAGTITLSYSKDGGNTWTVEKVYTLTIGKPIQVVRKRNVKARRFRWKLEGTSGSFDILSYKVYAAPGGNSIK